MPSGRVCVCRQDTESSERLTELGVAVAASGELLQVALQHIREQLAGGQLYRVPAQRLAQLRHRHPHQRARVALTHLPAGHKPSQSTKPRCLGSV